MGPELSIADLDNDIATFRYSLLRSPRCHSVHTTSLHILMMARHMRYRLSQEKEDLDRCILHCTEAIFLPPTAGLSLNIVSLLTHLASALLLRSKFDPEDVEYSIEYLRYLRGLPLDSFDVRRKDVTTLLVGALATQVGSAAGDWTLNIEEMVVLCRELLTLNISADFPVTAFELLGDAVGAEVLRDQPIQSLDKVIECLRDAVKACPPVVPGSHRVLYVLADSLHIRFIRDNSIDDYENAMAFLEMIRDPKRPGGCPDKFRFQAQSLASALASARASVFENPEYSEESISRLRALLSSPFIGEDEEHHLWVTQALTTHTALRFERYNLAESLEEANFRHSQVVDLSPSLKMSIFGLSLDQPDIDRKTYSTMAIQQKIQQLEHLLSSTSPGTSQHEICLRELAIWYRTKFIRTKDISDIKESIKYYRLQLDATRSSTQWGHYVIDLFVTLFLAFKYTGESNYLDEVINLGRDILKMECARIFHFYVTGLLVTSLLIRSQLPGRREDVNEAVQLIPLAVDNQYAEESSRFQLSCVWAHNARRIQHPSVLIGYKTAMSLIQTSPSFAPTVSIQHTRLIAVGEHFLRIPLDYASYLIHLGRFEEAVETLEQGRALLWSEMRGFRTSVAQLSGVDPLLAKILTEINQELEALTISVTPSARFETETDSSAAHDSNWTDPFGRLVVKRQKLLEERNALISQIQGRPGLEGFLKTPSFTTLRSAASGGPVILINHCKWRSDILIIFHNSLPCSIPTASDFYDRANKLRDELVEARKAEHGGLDSVKYQDTLSSVLKGLYELVGEPVIKRLRLLGVPEQSRIWWCPTSVFCSLPLHAMGPIPSSDTPKQYFSDLYIPSYTPSLSALIESRNAGPQMPGKPSLLLVAQLDDSLPGVRGEIKVVRALKSRITVTGLVSNKATPTSVVEGLRGSRFAHFACHGELEPGKPFEASFKLHGGSRLTLLDIVQSRLPDAEFAFLSCCHTAGITEDSLGDEVLHLAAAMQYCGFRSVVGTMWAMADTDGRDLSKGFYTSLLSSQETGVPYYERSAGALRDATQRLRGKKGITLERWVNFVHYGA